MESTSKTILEKITSSQNKNLREVESLDSFKIQLPLSKIKKIYYLFKKKKSKKKKSKK